MELEQIQRLWNEYKSSQDIRTLNEQLNKKSDCEKFLTILHSDPEINATSLNTLTQQSLEQEIANQLDTANNKLLRNSCLAKYLLLYECEQRGFDTENFRIGIANKQNRALQDFIVKATQRLPQETKNHFTNLIFKYFSRDNSHDPEKALTTCLIFNVFNNIILSGEANPVQLQALEKISSLQPTKKSQGGGSQQFSDRFAEQLHKALTKPTPKQNSLAKLAFCSISLANKDIQSLIGSIRTSLSMRRERTKSKISPDRSLRYRLFNNDKLSRARIALIDNHLSQLEEIKDLEDVVRLLNDLKIQNTNLTKRLGRIFFFDKKGGLNKYLNSVIPNVENRQREDLAQEFIRFNH